MPYSRPAPTQLFVSAPTGLTTRVAWLLLGAWTALFALLAARGGAFSWHYFAQGGRLLTIPQAPCGGWHVYACHPELQFGPLTLVAAATLSGLPAPVATLVAVAVMLAVGPLLLVALASARRGLTGRVMSPGHLLVTGLLVLPLWTQLAVRYAHLDDVLALALLVLGVIALVHHRPFLGAVSLAAAVGAKPWAAGFLAMLWVVPSWQRSRCLALAGVAVVAPWLPFLVADPGTLRLGGFTIQNAAGSALRALGVTQPSTPWWDRPAQLLLAVAVAAVLLRGGRWLAIPLAVVASRMLLDPEIYPYYSAGLLVAALVVDLLSRPWRRVPVWTAACASWAVADLAVAALLGPADQGRLRLVFLSGLLVSLVLWATVRRPGARSGPRPATAPATAPATGVTAGVGAPVGSHGDTDTWTDGDVVGEPGPPHTLRGTKPLATTRG